MGARLALSSVFTCIAALAAAGTIIGVALDDATGGRRCHAQWVDAFLVTAGGLSAACAVVVISLQSLRAVTGASPRSLRAAAAVAGLGLAANAAMLLLLTVYWRHFATRLYWQPYLGDSERVVAVPRRINYFEHAHRWTAEDAALYWVGCAGGTAAWLLTAALAAAEARAARRAARGAAAAGSAGLIPLTAALLDGADYGCEGAVQVRMAPSPVKQQAYGRVLQLFWPTQAAAAAAALRAPS